MKQKHFLRLSFWGCLAFVLAACQKYHEGGTGSAGNQQSYTSESVTLRINQPYEYNLGDPGREGSVAISTQAQHYIISTTYRGTGSNLLYRYVPAVNYTGSDKVILQSRKGTASSNDLNTANITIDFTIIP